MKDFRLKPVLLSTVMVTVLLVSLMTLSSTSADSSPTEEPLADIYENILQGYDNAYNRDDTDPPPRVWYGPDPPRTPNPPVMGALDIDGGGRVAAGGIVISIKVGPHAMSEPVDDNIYYLLDATLEWLGQKSNPKVLWQSDGVYEVYYCEDHGGENIVGYTIDNLRAMGNDIEFDTQRFADEILSNYDVLVIPQLQGQRGMVGGLLPQSEVDAIETFVKVDGGGLLVLDGSDDADYPFWSNYEVHNQILAVLGMPYQFQHDEVRDNVNNLGAPYYNPIIRVDNSTWIGEKFENDSGTNSCAFRNISSLAPPSPGVDLSIEPPYRDVMPGSVVTFELTVKNTGGDNDNFILEVKENTLPCVLADNEMNNIEGGYRFETTTLTITSPADRAYGVIDNFTVAVESTVNPEAVDNERATVMMSTWIQPPSDDKQVVENSSKEMVGVGDVYWLHVGSKEVYGDERAYLKFDIENGGFPEGYTVDNIENVRLYLWMYGSHDHGIEGELGFNVEVWSASRDNWTESDIEWANMPENENYCDVENIAKDDAWYSWDVTEVVKEAIQSDNLVSFCLKPEFENRESVDNWSYGFYSKDAVYSNIYEDTRDGRGPAYDYHPYLVFGVRPVISDPEPDYYRDGLPGGKVSIEAIVANRGAVVDNYTLDVSDTEGWSPSVSPSSLSNVVPGQESVVVITVDVPDNASLGTLDNITLKATSGKDNKFTDEYRLQVYAAWQLRPPIDDAYVWESAPDNNYGYPHSVGASYEFNTYLNVWSSTENNKRAYLKFNLENGLPPGWTGGNLKKVTLRLYCWIAENADLDVQVWGMANDDWLENEITWSNQPFDNSTDNLLDTVTLIKDDVDKWYSWDVTSFVKSQRDSDNVASFCVKAENENSADDAQYAFEAKEWGGAVQDPYLHILDNFGLSLGSGWNLISIPMSLEDQTRSAIFGGVTHFMSGWTGTGYYTPGMTDNLDPGEGYWVWVPSATTIEIWGEPLGDFTLSLSSGWNMIGIPMFYPPLDNRERGKIFEGVTHFMSGWTGTGYYTPGMSDNLEPGEGYWVWVPSATQITLP